MRRRGQLHKISGFLDEYQRIVCRLRRHDKYERRRRDQRKFLCAGKQFQFGKQRGRRQLERKCLGGYDERWQLDWRKLYQRSSGGSGAVSKFGYPGCDQLSG